MISASALTFMRLVVLYSDTHVRLTGYNLTHAGRVEVLSNGVWGRVTDGWWNQWRKQEAAVVCRQLGFAGVITALNYLPSGSVPIVMSRVQCVGTEKSLQQCRYNDFVNNYLYSSRDVGVVCKPHRFYPVDYYNIQIRLQGSLLPNAGRIEILYAGVWGTIGRSNWDVNDANVVCRQLGYQAGAEAALKNRVYGPFIGPTWLTNLQCTGYETNVMDCAHDGIANKTERSSTVEFASVICKDGKTAEEKKIRLKGSHQPNMGRIEVYFAGRWGAIYPWFGTSITKKNALTVVCRQLGYTGALLSGYDMFCSEAVQPWFTNLRCNGSEISLNQCGLDFYSHTSVTCMNVICTNQKAGSGYGVRLSGSSTPHAGRVEIGILGIWGSIYSELLFFLHRLYFSSETQRIICRQLGFNDSILGTVWVQKGSTIRPRWFSDYEFRCLGKERNIRDCISSPQPQLTRRDHYDVQDLGVVCKPNVSQIDDFQVRLTGSNISSAGTIEVSYYGVWGSIFYIDIRVGRVICRQLGYSDAQQVFRSEIFGQLNGPVLIERISCNGNESVISQCTIMAINERGPWYYLYLRYRAGVLCAESQAVLSKDLSVRLAGSPISNAGKVEVFYAGVWGTIDTYQWNIKNAHVVCLQLGYPGAISSGESNQFVVGQQVAWFSNVRCLGNESSFQECPKSFAGYLGSSGATALCKLPYQPDSSQSCSNLNCASNGKCMDSAAGAVCNCTGGFAGLHCQIPLSTPCKSSPCKNGGQCFSNNSSYVCACPDGLTGKQCEERILKRVDPCLSHPCTNKTSCFHNGTNYLCLPNDEVEKTTIHENLKGNTDSNSYIIAISVSVIVALVAAVVCLVFKIRQLMALLATRPSHATKVYHNNAFKAEPADEPPKEQRTGPTDIDLGLIYANVNDGDKNVRDYDNVDEMSSRPLPSVPSERAKKDDSLAPTKRYANSNPYEAKAQAQASEMHYMGLQRENKNRAEGIATVNEPASYMPLSPRRPEQVVYSGLSHHGGESRKPKHRAQHGKKTKGRMYARPQK